MYRKVMFEGKVVLVTGSSQGIGFRTAELLAHRGAKVIINGRNQEKVMNAVERLKKQGLTAIGIPGDVSNHDFCLELRNKIVTAFGGIDFLINNAGLAAKGRLEDMQSEVYRMIFEVNVMGSLNPTLAVLNDLKKSKGGVLFISSLAGLVGLPSYSAYSSTKSAVIRLAESFRNELVDEGVFVGVNHPGFTENDPDKTTVAADGKLKKIKKRSDVKVQSLDETVVSIIRQMENKKFRVFSSYKGKWLDMIYRFFPFITLSVLKSYRQRIMAME